MIRKAAASTRPPPFTAEELQQISAEIADNWFRPDPANHLTLLEVDPWNVHAYWHVSPVDIAATRKQLAAGSGDPALILRFIDLSPQVPGYAPHPPFDVEVHPASEHHYLHVWRDARRYSAELGLRSGDGSFAALARSNEIFTPPAGPSPERDYRIARVSPPPPAVTHAPVEAGMGHPAIDHLLSELMPPIDVVAGADLSAEWRDDLADAAGQNAEATLPSLPALPPVPPEMVAPACHGWLCEKVGAGGTASMSAPSLSLEAWLGAAGGSSGNGMPAIRASIDLRIAGQVSPGTRLTLFGEAVPVQEEGGFQLSLTLTPGPDLLACLYRWRDRHGSPGDKDN